MAKPGAIVTAAERKALAAVLRALADWKYASPIVGLLLAAATIMFAIERFRLFYILLALSGVYCCVLLWKSKYVRRKRERHERRTEQVPLLKLQVIGVIVIVALFGGTGLLARQYEIRKELAKLGGRLYPASDLMPRNNCGELPPDVVVLFLGDTAHEVRTFPHKILLIDQKERVTLNKSPDGYIVPLVNIKSDDGKVIVRLDTKGFVINPSNYLSFERPDRSTLQVEDAHGDRVLYARYLNSRAFRLTGVLHYPGVGEISLSLPQFPNACFEVGPHGEEFAADINIVSGRQNQAP